MILDNRPEANPGEQVMSIDDATVMNKLLHRPIYGDWGTATSIMSNLPMEIYGKTGTTEKIADWNASNSDVKTYIASYCGFAPAEDPKYALLVFFGMTSGRGTRAVWPPKSSWTRAAGRPGGVHPEDL